MTPLTTCGTMSEKRKRDLNISNSSYDSSLLDQKRSRHYKSITESDNSLDLSTGNFIESAGQSLGNYVCETSTPLVTPAMATKTDINIDQLQQVLYNLLVKSFGEQRERLIEEIRATVSHEFDEMRGEIHDMKMENNELKKRVSQLEAASVSKTDAKIHAVNNDQYARRYDMVVYGIKLQDKQDPGDAVIDVVKDHLATTLPR